MLLNLRSGCLDAKYNAYEQTLAAAPVMTTERDANGAPYPKPGDYRAQFTSRCEHRLIRGGIGRNLPLEAPTVFAAAVLALSRA